MSNIFQRYKDKIKFATDINKETYFTELLFLFGLIKNKKIEPIIGNKIKEDIIGKFIN